MEFIEANDIFSNFRDDELLIPKKGHIKIEVDNLNNILNIFMVYLKDQIYYNQTREYQFKHHKVIF